MHVNKRSLGSVILFSMRGIPTSRMDLLFGNWHSRLTRQPGLFLSTHKWGGKAGHAGGERTSRIKGIPWTIHTHIPQCGALQPSSPDLEVTALALGRPNCMSLRPHIWPAPAAGDRAEGSAHLRTCSAPCTRCLLKAHYDQNTVYWLSYLFKVCEKIPDWGSDSTRQAVAGAHRKGKHSGSGRLQLREKMPHFCQPRGKLGRNHEPFLQIHRDMRPASLNCILQKCSSFKFFS